MHYFRNRKSCDKRHSWFNFRTCAPVYLSSNTNQNFIDDS